MDRSYSTLRATSDMFFFSDVYCTSGHCCGRDDGLGPVLVPVSVPGCSWVTAGAVVPCRGCVAVGGLHLQRNYYMRVILMCVCTYTYVHVRTYIVHVCVCT